MAEAVATPADVGATPATRVMLLSLWSDPGQAWHARLVTPDAAVHEFYSPFELARYLAQAPPRVDPAAARSLK